MKENHPTYCRVQIVVDVEACITSKSIKISALLFFFVNFKKINDNKKTNFCDDSIL